VGWADKDGKPVNRSIAVDLPEEMAPSQKVEPVRNSVCGA
jgi:hypothetical protein